MGMSTYILDRADEYYDKASTVLNNGCEHYDEFVTAMQEHKHLLQGTGDLEHVDDLLQELWQEHCSQYCYS